mmetsp:Transcript_44629/g.129849  ORF Transcript_44629/g.129849 Transcript_44629/m.129849 type:complete len:232 (+) Transcript_44629:255-950(+)
MASAWSAHDSLGRRSTPAPAGDLASFPGSGSHGTSKPKGVPVGPLEPSARGTTEVKPSLFSKKGKPTEGCLRKPADFTPHVLPLRRTCRHSVCEMSSTPRATKLGSCVSRTMPSLASASSAGSAAGEWKSASNSWSMSKELRRLRSFASLGLSPNSLEGSLCNASSAGWLGASDECEGRSEAHVLASSSVSGAPGSGTVDPHELFVNRGDGTRSNDPLPLGGATANEFVWW